MQAACTTDAKGAVDSRHHLINDHGMANDAFQLVQEAVSNWESLDGVAAVEVVEERLADAGERGFLARVAVFDRREPIHIELRIVEPSTLFEARLREGRPVGWRDEPWE